MVRSRIISRVRNFILSRVNAGEGGESGGEQGRAVFWSTADDVFWSDDSLMEWSS